MFFLWNQSINIINPNEENVLMMPNLEMKRDYYMNLCLSQLKDVLQFLNLVTREVFLLKPKQQYHWSQRGECVYGTQSWKERRLLCESMFITIERRTSVPEW